MNTNSSWCKGGPEWLAVGGGEHATEKFRNYRYLYKCLVVENDLLDCFESFRNHPMAECNSVAAL